MTSVGSGSAAASEVVAAQVAPGKDVEFLRRLGVSVHWLQTKFLSEVDAFCSESNSTSANLSRHTVAVYNIEPWIRTKGASSACPVDNRKGSSYVHALWASDDPEEHTASGRANYMLSYGWKYIVTDIVDTLADFCATKELDPKTTYIWICCLCNNQHRVKEMEALGTTVPFEEFQEIFYRNVTGVKNILAMMSPWQKPIYLTRIWCIFELFTAHSNAACSITIIMPPKERADLQQQLLAKGAQEALNSLFETLATTKVQDATASIEEDRVSILKLINDINGSYTALNHRVNDLLRDWAVETVKSLAPQVGDIHSKNAAEIFSHIGSVLYQQGDYKGALVEFNKALAIKEAVLGKDHPETASTYGSIGSVLLEKGDYEGALMENRKALAIEEVVLGKDHPNTAITYNNIGSALSNQGKYDSALVEYRKAADTAERIWGMDHPNTATFYNNIGSVLSDQGKYDGALVEYRKAADTAERIWGIDHPTTATFYNNIGKVLYEQKDYSGALVEFRRSLTIAEAALEVDHPTNAITLNNIGNILYQQGDCEDALVEYRKALAIKEAVLGKNHPEIAAARNNIGLILSQQGDFKGALMEHRNALAIREAVLGTFHPDTATSYNNVAGVLCDQEDYIGAVAEYRKALEISESILGKENPTTATFYNNIGHTLSEQGDYEGSLVEHRNALAIREAVLGNDHPETAASKERLEALSQVHPC